MLTPWDPNLAQSLLKTDYILSLAERKLWDNKKAKQHYQNKNSRHCCNHQRVQRYVAGPKHRWL